MRMTIRHLAGLAALALFVAPLPGRPAGGTSDERAAALLAKHRAYVGWQFGDGTFTTFRIQGAVTGPKGKVKDRVTILVSGLAFNEAATSVKAGTTDHTGFTGSIFWRSNMNGVTVPVYGGLAKFDASMTMLRLEGTSGLPGTFQKSATVDGRHVDVVRVTLDHGLPMDLSIDPETGAYVQVRVDPDGGYDRTLHILGYTDVAPGKKMISKLRGDDKDVVTTYDTIETNVPVTAGELHPPAATSKWTFDNPDPAPLKITYDRILVDATINGQKGRFILDTGADGIYLDDRFADRIHAPVQGNATAVTVYDEVPTRIRKLDTLTVAGATLHDVLATSQDFERDDYHGLDYAGYDGLIGFDLFASSIVKLDTYDAKISILDPETTDTSNWPGVPMIVDLSDGTPVVPMTLFKTMDVNAFLDTGNPTIVLFGPGLVKRGDRRLMTGCAHLDLAIGPISYDQVAGCDWGFAGNYMLLGYDFLKHFDMVFDYPHGRLILKQNPNQSV